MAKDEFLGMQGSSDPGLQPDILSKDGEDDRCEGVLQEKETHVDDPLLRRPGHVHVVRTIRMYADHGLPRDENLGPPAAVEEVLVVAPVVPLVLLAEIMQRDALHGVSKYENSHGWTVVFGGVKYRWNAQGVPDDVRQLAACATQLPLRCPFLPPKPR